MGNETFRSPQQHRFHECTPVRAEHRGLLLCCNTSVAISHFANKSGGIAYMCKRQRLELRVLHYVKSCVRRRSNTYVSETHNTVFASLLVCICLQYISCDLADPIWSNVTPRAHPISQMEILVNGVLTHWHSAVSFSRRLPT